MRAKSTLAFAVAILVTGLVMGSAAFAARSKSYCPTRPGDAAAVVGTINGFFDAASRDNLAQFKRYITRDFYAYDGGRIYRGDALLKTIMALHGKGYKFVWSVTEPDVHLLCDDAWIAYTNKGSIKAPDQPVVPTTWLKSAFLRHTHYGWKLVFFHSTRVPVPTK